MLAVAPKYDALAAAVLVETNRPHMSGGGVEERRRCGVYRPGRQSVPDPAAPFVAIDQPGLSENFEVVRHRRLRLADWANEVAGAHFAVGGRGDHRQDLETNWIGQCPQPVGEQQCRGGIEFRPGPVATGC